MIEQLRLENFKSLAKAKLDFGLITVLIGPNGTGKSSIAQSLILLKQSIGDDMLRVGGRCINLGDFNDVLTKSASEGKIGIGLSIGIADFPALNIHGGSYSYDVHFDTNGIIGHQVAISSAQGTHLVANVGIGLSPTLQPKRLLNEKSPSVVVKLAVFAKPSVATPFGSILSSSGSAESTAERKDFETRTRQLLSEIEVLLSHTFLVPAIRGLESPDYTLTKEFIMDLGLGQNAQITSTFAYSERTIQELVSNWSEAITGSELTSTLVEGRKVTIKSYAAPRSITVINDGFGTNQLIQMLLTLAITPERSVVAIEEPEIHLHPKAQEKLCSTLVKIAKTSHKQLILTTHSEHVLFAFLSAVRSGTLKKHDLAIYNFEEKGKEPCRLDVDEYGEIDEWRRNFFSQYC